MSDAPKVEEPVVAAPVEIPAVAEPVVEAPAAETTAPEAATDAPAVEAAPAAEETPAAAEATPVEEGVLGYKGPGLLKYVLTFHPSQLFLSHCDGALCHVPALRGLQITHGQTAPAIIVIIDTPFLRPTVC
jgi:hypothetical protein